MNKILISVYVLTIEEEYDMFIPINENMKNVLNLIQQTVNELSDECFIIIEVYYMILNEKCVSLL